VKKSDPSHLLKEKNTVPAQGLRDQEFSISKVSKKRLGPDAVVS
jgi:hypothetical protein